MYTCDGIRNLLNESALANPFPSIFSAQPLQMQILNRNAVFSQFSEFREMIIVAQQGLRAECR
jgi:hypothetical protein